MYKNIKYYMKTIFTRTTKVVNPTFDQGEDKPEYWDFQNKCKQNIMSC